MVRWEFKTEAIPDKDSSLSVLGEEDEEDSTQIRWRRSSKKRRRDSRPEASQTSSQRHRKSTAYNYQIEAITGDTLIKINDIHHCKMPSCPNYPKPCVVVPNEPHLPLSTNGLKR